MSRKRRIKVKSDMIFRGEALLNVVAAYDPNSTNDMEHYQIYDWNQGPGTNLPNNWLHKGQDYYANERKLYDQLNTEMINLNGMVGEYYLTSYDVTHDKFFGEDLQRHYERKFDFMFHSDDMPTPNYQQTGWGLWADDVFSIHITKTHFTAASTQAGAKDDGTPGVDKGFVTTGDNFNSEPSPRKADYIKVKALGVYFRVLGVTNKYDSLQGTSYWIVTMQLMKDNQVIKASNEYGQEDKLEDIVNAKNQSREDTDLFDLRQSANDAADEVAYQEEPEEKSEMNNAWVGDDLMSSDNEYWD